MAIVLFKGHNKDKTSDRSYRTISTCPVVAKGLDTYVRGLHLPKWNLDKSDTQFQAEGSSHELAALLLTEVIQQSLHGIKQPLYVLFLDAKSAFDVVLKELLIKNLYHCNTTGQSLVYFNNRLENRETFIEWDGKIVGPIFDESGLEQGGINSSCFYKIFGKEQLSSAQQSELGVKISDDLIISGIGQADDTLLLSNNIQNLMYLLHLTKVFCTKYQIQLCAEKTKLLAFHSKGMEFAVDYAKAVNPLQINDEQITFVDSAEHVGMLRSTSGNHVTIQARITAHKRHRGTVSYTHLTLPTTPYV